MGSASECARGLPSACGRRLRGFPLGNPDQRLASIPRRSCAALTRFMACAPPAHPFSDKGRPACKKFAGGGSVGQAALIGKAVSSCCAADPPSNPPFDLALGRKRVALTARQGCRIGSSTPSGSTTRFPSPFSTSTGLRSAENSRGESISGRQRLAWSLADITPGCRPPRCQRPCPCNRRAELTVRPDDRFVGKKELKALVVYSPQHIQPA
jgi:hypothetical protein